MAEYEPGHVMLMLWGICDSGHAPPEPGPTYSLSDPPMAIVVGRRLASVIGRHMASAFGRTQRAATEDRQDELQPSAQADRGGRRQRGFRGHDRQVPRRHLDGAGPVEEYARRLSGGPDGTGAFRRRRPRGDRAGRQAGTAGLHRLAGGAGRKAPFHGPSAVQFPPLLPLPVPRRRHRRRSDGGHRDAAHRPLVAEVTHRGGGRVAAGRAEYGGASRSP